MADRKSLGIIGFILGGITAAVITVGIVVVQAHLTGRLALDQAASGPVVSVAQSAS